MRKNLVIDTSVLIHEPTSIFNFGDNTIIIPAKVLEELDKLKSVRDESRSMFARRVLDIFKDLTEGWDVAKNEDLDLEGGGKLRFELNHVSFAKLRGIFDEDIPDNRILAVAKNYSEEDEYTPTILITNDKGLLIKARSLGIRAEEYHGDILVDNLADGYKGYREIEVDDDLLKKFQEDGKLSLDNLPIVDAHINEFIIMSNISPLWKKEMVGRVVEENGELIIRKLLVDNSSAISRVRAKSLDQLMLMDLLVDDKVNIVTVMGPAGTGKTLLSLAAGLEGLEEEKYKSVILLKSLSTVGEEDSGALPGDLEEKLTPYMDSYYDNLEYIQGLSGRELSRERIRKHFGEKLEIMSAGLARGRTLPDRYIIVDEVQNLTKHVIKTLLTRVGEGSKIVLCGDASQVDNKYLNSLNNGLVYVNESMKDSYLAGSIYMYGESKRSDTAKEALKYLK